MERFLECILSSMKLRGVMEEDEEDVYRFGLECLLLKIVHYSSYIIIGMILKMTIPMLLSAVTLLPLRRKAGGFHARTRWGCYLVSCTIVVVICLLDKIVFPMWLSIITFLGSNVTIFAFGPVENESRLLEQEERKKFRKQMLFVLLMADAVIIILGMKKWLIFQWLLNGMVVVALLTLFGQLQTKY